MFLLILLWVVIASGLHFGKNFSLGRTLYCACFRCVSLGSGHGPTRLERIGIGVKINTEYRTLLQAA
jgi:hypothetical protein